MSSNMWNSSNPNSTSPRPGSKSRHPDTPRRAAPLVAALGLLLAAGCTDQQFDTSFKKVFTPKRTPQQYMLVAVSDADPDQRRIAVAKVAESKRCGEDWAIKGFATIALLESDPQTRCVAIRALGRTHDPRAIETCLKILNSDDYPPADVRPPDDLCRGDTTGVLADLVGEVPDRLRDKVRETFLKELKQAPDRESRIAAARGLQAFPRPEVVDALIAGLRDDDFAVVYQCEVSLAWLTGVTHNCDAYQWSQWVEAHAGHLFDHGGRLPEGLRRPYEGRWDRLAYQSKEFFRWLIPGAKEK